ncbi:MAG: hypothetical protein DCC49_07770 [Acidobacteria bacterium]|nr:MAG: hypothetical protein DCC49_07770 [Acidobacteriota bacterium]
MTAFFGMRNASLEVLDPLVTNELNSPVIVGGGEIIYGPGDPYFDHFRIPGPHILNSAGVLSAVGLEYLKDYLYLSVRTGADKSRVDQATGLDVVVVPCVSAALAAGKKVRAPGTEVVLAHLTHNAVVQCAGLAEAFAPFSAKELRWLTVESGLPEPAAMLRVGIDLGWVPEIELTETPTELLASVGSARAVVASSYYSAQFAHQQNTPFVAFGRDPEVRAFLADRNLEDLAFFSAAELAEKLAWILASPPDFSETIERDRTTLAEHFKKLAELTGVPTKPSASDDTGTSPPVRLDPARTHDRIEMVYALRKYREMAERGAHLARSARHWRDLAQRVNVLDASALSAEAEAQVPERAPAPAPVPVSIPTTASADVATRILFVVHQYLPFFPTGVERATQNLASQLMAIGHDAVVLSAPPSSPDTTAQPEAYIHEGIRVLQPRSTRLHSSASECRYDESTAATIRAAIDAAKPDVIHLMHALVYPETRQVAQECGKPVVIHLHDYFYACPRINMIRPDGTICKGSNAGKNCELVCGVGTALGEERHEWARNELASADAVIVPTDFVREVFSNEGFDTEDWIKISAGIDYSVLKISQRPASGSRLRVRFLGTLQRHKAPHVLIEAVKLAAKSPIDAHIHGDCYHETEYLEELIVAAADDERFHFDGPYEYSELGPILGETDVVVVPSTWNETQSIVVQSSLAAGVPVIAANLGGMAEIVRDHNGGYLVEAGNVDELSRLLARLANDPSELSRSASAIRAPQPIEYEGFLTEKIYSALRQ